MRISGTDSGSSNHGDQRTGPLSARALISGMVGGGAALLAIGFLVLGGHPAYGALSVHGPETVADTLAVWELSGDPDSDDPVERGAYIARIGNCVVCHTADPSEETGFLAGGAWIESPFGNFYGTNITPHPEYGIGAWTEEDLVRSLREGRGPDGAHLYPAFPYTSFTGMTDGDISDLYAFLQAVPPVARENEDHDIAWFASIRLGLAPWKALNFREWRFEPDPDQDDEWNRGAYLTRAVAHCAECHTPRTRTGGLVEDLRYAGTEEGADGESVPNITPHESGIEDWSQRHLERYLQIGMTPDGDFAGGSMADIIAHATSFLTDEDRQAMARYILSLEPVDNQVEDDSDTGEPN